MNRRTTPTDSRIERFWNPYFSICQTFRVPEKALPWYRRHAQAFIDHYPNIHLQAQSAENLKYWFEALGRNEQMTKWQYAERELRLQYLFPASRLAQNPRTGIMHHHHIHQSVIQKTIKQVAAKANILKRVTSHTMRHSFATSLLQSGTDIRTLQDLLGHEDVSTTMIYTHVIARGGQGARSPLDALEEIG